MLPRHGTVYSILLLTRTANITARRSVSDWVNSARVHGSFLASAIDIAAYAQQILDCGLAYLEDKVVVAPALVIAGQMSGRNATSEVACLLLSAQPPLWLYLAVAEDKVSREYIPTADLNALLWLEPNLDQVLVRAHRNLTSDRQAALAKEIGDAAELFVLAAMRHRGQEPIHVARLSDCYGYDIELPGSDVECIEVKAAGPRTAGQFHISRNEFDTGQRRGKRWRLLQLVFTSSAFTTEVIGPSHVDSIQEVPHDVLRLLVPLDTPTFVWEQSAKVTLPKEAWQATELALDPDFSIPGFRSSPRQA